MNPITQMKQLNAAQIALNAAVTAKKGETKPTTAEKVKPAKTGKLSLSRYPQISYLFQQGKWNAANCKLHYPDCFHHKLNQRRQLHSITEIFAKSDRLLNELAQGKSGFELNPDERKTLAEHLNAVRYLRSQLAALAGYITQVEQSEGEALNALCYRQNE